MFPEASFAFSGGVKYELAPENYLFRVSERERQGGKEVRTTW